MALSCNAEIQNGAFLILGKKMLSISNKKISIGSYSLSKGMAYLILIYPLFLPMLQELLGLPGVVKYIVDVAWLLIAVVAIMQDKLRIRRDMIPLALIVAFFGIYTFGVYLFRYQSVFYYLWGFRNYFRFYVAFFAFATVFTEGDAYRGIAFLEKVFYINAAICLFQFINGNAQDNIGGIFGAEKGCNGYLIAYFSVIISKSILAYMEGKEAAVTCYAKCITTLFVSAIAELKFFYLVFVVILLMSSFLTSFSFKKVLLLFLGAVLVMITATILGSLYAYFEGFLSIESLTASFLQKGYASGSDMGRTDAIAFISRRFLRTTTDRLFGLGLGNCETSAVSIFNTAFSDRYVDLHYSVLSHAFMFLENGYVGLVTYVLFFVVCLFIVVKRLKNRPQNRLFSQMGIIMAVECMMLIIYNSSLRTEAGYMIYFVLALPFIRMEHK